MSMRNGVTPKLTLTLTDTEGAVLTLIQLNSTGHVTLMAKRDQKRGKKATAYQYSLSLI